MSGPWVTDLEADMVMDAMKNGWYGKDAYTYVETFEAEFAKYHGRKYALMTPNCTTALHLLQAGLGIGEGDQVIVPECTWVGSSAAITYLRAKTVFADIDPVHWCLTPESIERTITPKTKAIIVVDLFGNMPDWDGIQAVANKHGVTLIEDAAEAVGSTYKGKRSGSFGTASVFSFHRTKTITTGEGGMLLLDDDALFERCKLLRDHGRQPGTYYNTEITFKYMPFNIQAALGLGQLKRVEELVDKKRWILNAYRERLAGIPDLLLNPEPDNGTNGAWCTALVFGDSHNMTRDTAMVEFNKRGIPSRPFFYPLSSLPAYSGREEAGRRDNPVAYDVSRRGINLPSALNITEDKIDTICVALHEMLGISDT